MNHDVQRVVTLLLEELGDMSKAAVLYIWILLCLVGVVAALIPAELAPD